MKTCIECGEDFMPKGRQKVCRVCKEKVSVQETRIQEADEEETRPKRPLERFGNQRVFHSGQYGVRVIRRGN